MMRDQRASHHLLVQVFNRKQENARDSSSSISAVQEFMESHKEVDVVCLIQVSALSLLQVLTVPCLVYLALHSAGLPRERLQDGLTGI